MIGSLCTGYGGLDAAVSKVFGGGLAWWSDVDPGAVAVSERHHPGVPNIGDVSTVDWSTVAPIDILTAGYPCQPFSEAGKRLGTQDSRHLWPHIARGIGVLRPGLVVLENVRGHLRRGLDAVIGDLAGLGYDAVWTTVRASDVGAPHRRERIFVLAADAHRSTGPRLLAGDSGPQHSLASPPRERDARSGGLDSAAADSVRGGCGRDEGDAGSGAVERVVADGDRARRLGRWGEYAAAVGRWELIMGRAVPEPTVVGARGARVLNPQLTEWMMGLPAGLVTDTPGLSRNQKLRLTGNGVVPRQAEFALRTLLAMRERWSQ